ncbi:MAG: hypothetical protein IPK21_23440 [Haliscomenobacter sp.]|nr:hypothetical protein [Haliscomenobacter sp.]
MDCRIVFGLFLFGLSHLQAQTTPNWAVVLPKAYAMLEQEAADSAAYRQSEGVAIRAEMEKILPSKGLERLMVFGPDDAYFKEGMHKKFSDEPRVLWMHMERDSSMIRLEYLHVSLYHSDKALFRWKDIQKRVATSKAKEDQAQWTLRFEHLPSDRQKALGKEKNQVLWVANEIACSIVSDLQRDSNQSPKKIESLDLDFQLVPHNLTENAITAFPIPSEKIPVSFPRNGQYGFCPTESIPGTGYVHFPDGTSALFEDTLWRNRVLKARWTGINGHQTYTQAAYQKRFLNPGIVFFNIPKSFFEKGMVYRLELVVIPESALTPNHDVSEPCFEKLRGNFPLLSVNTKRASIPNEILLTELYFRTSKYTVLGKSITLKGTMNWNTGILSFVTDEPFDPTETQPSDYAQAPVSFIFTSSQFHTLSQKLQDQTINYYMRVPQVEDLSKLGPNEPAIIELDNTLNAPFMRSVGNGNPSQFKWPDSQKGAPASGSSHLVPAFSDSDSSVPDTLVADKAIPFISRVHFDKNSY